ncbi:hypothetical protein D9M70_507700 [compost metagenome]
MGDHQGGDAELALQGAQFAAQMLAHTGIEGRHRLVEQQQRRARRQGAGQRHALLLAAGKLRRVLLRATGQADQFEHLSHPCADRLAALAGQAVGDVLHHREVGEQRVGLEQDAVVACLWRQVGDIAPGKANGAAVLLFQASDAAQKGGLAAAGRAEQADQLSGADIQRHAVQRLEGAEALVDVAQLQIDGGHVRTS